MRTVEEVAVDRFTIIGSAIVSSAIVSSTIVSSTAVGSVVEAAADGRRWVAVGWSTDPDPAVAARAAASGAMHGTDPALVVVFCSADVDPQAVLTGVRDITGAVPLVGCSSQAVLTPVGRLDDAIVVVTLGGPGFQVATAAASTAGGRVRAAGAEVAARLTDTAAVDRPHRALLLLSDGYTPDQEGMLAGVYGIVGASVPLIGGTASPPRRHGPTFQLHGTDVLRDCAVGVLLGSDVPLGVGLRHGWRRVGEPLVVTHSANGTVKTLNDQPALRTYLDRLGAPAAAYRDPVAFQDFARTRPVGVSRRTGEDLRDVSALEHHGDGWLHSSGEIPEGGLVWLMEGDVEAVLDAAATAADEAVDALGGRPALGLLAFDCVSRTGMLGPDGTRAEAARLAALRLPMAGVYTWGEIARTQGINAYHNLTLTLLAVG